MLALGGQTRQIHKQVESPKKEKKKKKKNRNASAGLMTRDDGWSSRIEKRSPGGPLARHAATFLFSRSLGSRSGLIDFDFGGFFWMGRVLFFVFDFLSSRRRLWPSDSVARVSFDWQLLRFFLVQIKIKSCFAFSFFYF